MTLLAKDVAIERSFVYGGYLILKQLKGDERSKVPFYDVSAELSKNGISQYRQQFFCLMFLYACDLIIFDEPYVELKVC